MNTSIIEHSKSLIFLLFKPPVLLFQNYLGPKHSASQFTNHNLIDKVSQKFLSTNINTSVSIIDIPITCCNSESKTFLENAEKLPKILIEFFPKV